MKLFLTILLTLVFLTAIMITILGCGDYNPQPDGDLGSDATKQIESAYCGNFLCERKEGETEKNCPEDCIPPTSYCGDGACIPPESMTTCFTDCRPYGYKEDKKFYWPWENEKPYPPKEIPLPDPIPPK